MQTGISEDVMSCMTDAKCHFLIKLNAQVSFYWFHAFVYHMLIIIVVCIDFLSKKSWQEAKFTGDRHVIIVIIGLLIVIIVVIEDVSCDHGLCGVLRTLTRLRQKVLWSMFLEWFHNDCIQVLLSEVGI